MEGGGGISRRRETNLRGRRAGRHKSHRLFFPRPISLPHLLPLPIPSLFSRALRVPSSPRYSYIRSAHTHACQEVSCQSSSARVTVSAPIFQTRGISRGLANVSTLSLSPFVVPLFERLLRIDRSILCCLSNRIKKNGKETRLPADR